jgi:hypothetical protein
VAEVAGEEEQVADAHGFGEGKGEAADGRGREAFTVAMRAI